MIFPFEVKSTPAGRPDGRRTDGRTTDRRRTKKIRTQKFRRKNSDEQIPTKFFNVHVDLNFTSMSTSILRPCRPQLYVHVDLNYPTVDLDGRRRKMSVGRSPNHFWPGSRPNSFCETLNGTAHKSKLPKKHRAAYHTRKNKKAQ